jgi:S1-C subfamily serine protease
MNIVAVVRLTAAACVLTACTSGPAGDTSTPTPQPNAAATAGTDGTSDQARIIRAVVNVKPSVVALDVVINGTQVVPPDPFSQLFGGQSAPTLQHFRAQASGSGFVYDRSGLIVTNSHVVHQSSRIQVVFSNGDRIPGTLFAEDVGADLALVKVSNYAKLPPPVTLGSSSDVRQGEWAIAIGEPFELQQTVTVGVVSGFNRSEVIGDEAGQPRQFKGLMQTSAPINPGNSGGPLTDIDGRLIGVNQSTASPASGAQGIGFAIPVDTMRVTVTSLIAHPGTRTGAGASFIGVQLLPLNGNLREQIGYSGGGVLIGGVISGSAADRAGLNPGDVIQQVDGQTVNSPEDVARVMSKVQPGQTVHLVVWSGGRIKNVDAKVTEAPIDANG